jgi:UDP-N-acetylmuramate--alanine ligase
MLVRRPDGSRGEYTTQLTGRHQAANAVAALAIARELGVADEAARAGLAGFRGTRRRFETLAHADDVWIVDDYAHHPTAVLANLNAARDVHGGRLVAVFQPHTVHRTRVLLDETAGAFVDADRVIVAPIFQPTGRGVDTSALGSDDLVARMAHPDAVAAESLDATYELARRELRPGTLVLVLGAGDITSVAHRLADAVNAGLAADPALSTVAAEVRS